MSDSSSRTSKKKEDAISLLPMSFSSIFWTKQTYASVASDFHPFHQHDLNVLAHLLTTSLGVWGVLQLAMEYNVWVAVYMYALVVAWTTPLLTASIHSAMVYGMMKMSVVQVSEYLSIQHTVNPLHVCLGAMVLGYGLQDLAHHLACEPTYMSSYITSKPSILLIHSLWLLPLVIDAVLIKYCFLSKLLVTRNRCLATTVASRQAVDDLRVWIQKNVPSTPETTHLWPHEHAGTDKPVAVLEKDSTIHAAFRKLFSSCHFDIQPVVPMNEIYVTAVGAKKEINSDAVFYTPHTDGPYWWLPGCSLYRVLVGVTENSMVRTRFNLQHESCDQILDLYSVVGFDYNRELHWIDHVPGATNKERRSLVKLHFMVYPKGWHRYGNLAARLNTSYNTWARGNFLKTLRPNGIYATVMAWWIWLTTWSNAMLEQFVGWSNLTYIFLAYLMGPIPFLVLTSFRHYAVYIATFACRQPPVALGYLIRDAQLYKMISMVHLAHRLLPMVRIQRDLPAVVLSSLGFGTTLLATARLGMVRTYFGSELGFVTPKWIYGFPYGYIPHPMINGQIFAFGVILYWFWQELSLDNMVLLVAHIACYATHMTQEILDG
jgi:hypothetical protein